MRVINIQTLKLTIYFKEPYFFKLFFRKNPISWKSDTKK